MVGVIDQEGHSRAKKSGKPRLDAALKTTNTWLLVVVIALACVIAFQSYRNSMLADLAAKNVQIEYVKLYPDGTWQRSDFDHKERQEYLPATINGILKDYVQARYGVFPPTIKNDYGRVGLYISDALYKKFTDSEDKGGFDAITKAATIAANNKSSNRIEIKDIWINHYDEVNGVFANVNSSVVRTNIYYTKVTSSPSGVQVGLPEKKILKIQWRLIPKKELEALATKNPVILDHNPVGLEVVDSEELDDPASAK